MINDLKEFLGKVQADKALQEKMLGIIKASAQEEVFANCNAVAAEMGYTITEEDMRTYADEYKADLNDQELDKVSGGTFSFTFLVTVPLSMATIGSAITYSIDEIRDLIRDK